MATASSNSVTSEVIAYEENGQPVKLVYDTWTPRPHFIVVQTVPKQDATTAEFQATYEIIGRFLRANRQFDEDAILSFHRGEWYQKNTGKWHAHLCVPEQPYLQQAEEKITVIPKNKEWKGARTVEEGMNGWRTRKLGDYAGYKNGCVSQATRSQPIVNNALLSMFDSDSSEFQLVWTSSAPRIGIVAQSPAGIKLASLYTFMSKVLSDIGKSFSKFGCHLCLYVSGQSDTNVTCRPGEILTKDGKLNTNQNIVGYIQMDEPQYLQLLPSTDLREAWLNAFSRAEHFVRT